MIARIIDWSGRNRGLVLFLSLALAALGVLAAKASPLDAVPDLSDPQVIVFSEWMGRSPELVEAQVTYPLVTGLQSLPGVKSVRGFTMFGMSFTYVLLQDGVDAYDARSRVLERLQQLKSRLPPDADVSLGPDASAVGWVYEYVLEDTTGTRTPGDLRAIQDWTLRFELPVEANNPVSRGLARLYRPAVGAATRWPWVFIGIAVLAVAGSVPLWRNLGREFMPPLYEGALLFMPVTVPGISAEQARQLLVSQDKAIRETPEVDHVLGKAGRAETATDPAPLSMMETIITLKPRDQWRPGLTPELLVAELEQKLEIPGVQNAFTMPIKARIDMLTTGIRTPVGVKVLGTDLVAMEAAATRIEAALRDLPGTRSVYAERQLAAVLVNVTPRPADLARLGAVADDVLDVVDLGLGGMPVGRIYEGRERYSLIARFGRDFRADEAGIEHLPVSTPLGVVPLGAVADVTRSPGAAMIVDEGGKLATYVYVDPGDRDLGGYVDEAKATVAALGLSDELQVVWTGQYEFLERATEQMRLLVPLTLALTFLLVWLAFRTVGGTLVVLATLPLSVLGSVWFLSITGYNLSIAGWVAMLALVGDGAQISSVLVVYLDLGVKEALARGEILTPRRLAEVAADSAAGRIRGVVLAIAIDTLGLIPVLVATGAGSDLARRMAGPTFGGMVSLTFMTTLVLPALWVTWRTHQLKRGTLGAMLARSKAEE